MENTELGNVLAVWLSLITIFNGVMVVQMLKNRSQEGAKLALVTSLFVFFGTGLSAFWIFRALS